MPHKAAVKIITFSPLFGYSELYVHFTLPGPPKNAKNAANAMIESLCFI